MRFFKLLWQNKVGFIGFCGLVFYLLLITVGQWLVDFDNEVKLDQVNSHSPMNHMTFRKLEMFPIT